MISYEEALQLLKKYIKDDEKTIKHCIRVSDYAYELSKKIKEKHPELKIDPEKVRVAGILHDIGKDVDYLHYFKGKEILTNEGLPELGVMISKHLKAHEIATLKNIKGDFLPQTTEEKILAYADLRTDKQDMVTAAQRIDNKLERARKKNEGEIKIKALEMSRDRVLRLEKEIEGLLK